MALPEIIALGLCLFPLFALGGTLLGAPVTGAILTACTTVTVALMGMPLSCVATLGTLVNTAILPFLFANYT